MTAQQIRDELEALIQSRQAVLSKADNEGRDLTDDERGELDQSAARFEALHTDLSRMQAVADNAESLRAFEPLPRKTVSESPRAADGESAVSGGPVRMVDSRTGNEVLSLGPKDKLARAGGRNVEFNLARAVCALRRGDWSDAGTELQALSAQTIGVDTDGGFLVPEAISNEVIDLVREKSRLMAAGVRTIPMTTSTLGIAVVEEGPTPNWRPELGKINTSDATFGRIVLSAKTLGAIVVSSEELLQDAPNADVLLRQLLADSLAEELDRAGMFGSGTSSEPLGIANWPGIETVDAGGAFAYAALIEALAALWDNGADPDTVIMSPRERAAIAGMVDTTGQPLVAPREIAALRFLTTRKIATDGGTGENESIMFVGGFDQCAFGIRQRLHISLANTGPINETGDDAFDHYAVRIRAVLRADFAVLRPDHVATLTGITPATP